MNNETKRIFYNFMNSRFPEADKEDSYYKEWKKRFENGYEWQYSDYLSRKKLKDIAPDVYPDNIDEFFVKE